MTASPVIEGRRADSARRRQRVIKAINEAARAGGEMTVSAIARSSRPRRTPAAKNRPATAAASGTSQRPPPPPRPAPRRQPPMPRRHSTRPMHRTGYPAASSSGTSRPPM
jgi:hypothetical protein